MEGALHVWAHVKHSESDTRSRSNLLRHRHICCALHAAPGAWGWCCVPGAFHVLIVFSPFVPMRTTYQGVLRDDV